jgi:hypothetical protein
VQCRKRCERRLLEARLKKHGSRCA